MVMYLKCCYSSKKGEHREINEDNLYACGKWLKDGHINDKGVKCQKLDNNVFGVFDGLGGESSGEKASLKAAETLHNITDMNHYFVAANEAVSAVKTENNKSCGSTAAILCFEGFRFYTVNLGDSRIYMLRNNVLKQLTVDHTVAETMVAAGVMTREEVIKSSLHNYLTRCLGNIGEENEIPTPDFSHKYDIMCGDAFVLCSDGLWGSVSEEEITYIVNAYKENSAEKLTETAYKNGATDNVTAVVVYVFEDSFFGRLKNLLITK